MTLRFGAPVVEHGRRVGRLAGLEVDPAARRVTMIVFSPDGRLGAHARARPADRVGPSGRSLVVRAGPAPAPPPRTVEPQLWSRATRLTRHGRPVGRLRAVTVDPATGAVQRVVGRRLWLLSVSLPGSALDFSKPGEIAAGAEEVRAA